MACPTRWNYSIANKQTQHVGTTPSLINKNKYLCLLSYFLSCPGITVLLGSVVVHSAVLSCACWCTWHLKWHIKQYNSLRAGSLVGRVSRAKELARRMGRGKVSLHAGYWFLNFPRSLTNAAIRLVKIDNYRNQCKFTAFHITRTVGRLCSRNVPQAFD